jgi:hypothetical protein
MTHYHSFIDLWWRDSEDPICKSVSRQGASRDVGTDITYVAFVVTPTYEIEPRRLVNMLAERLTNNLESGSPLHATLAAPALAMGRPRALFMTRVRG